MGRYLDPKNDLPFKRIFGEHPELLISFLNALMPFEEDRYIISIEYLPSELIPDTPGKKNSIVDVRCRDNEDRQFIVEMQMHWNVAFSKRIVFNASKAYVRQIDKGELYPLLQPVYALGIINDVFDHETSKYYHHYGIINYENSNEVLEGLEFVLIELPKFTPTSLMEKKMAVLWLRFLKETDAKKHIVPDAELMENEYIRKAIELCEKGAFTEEELLAYDEYWDIVRTENSMLYVERIEGRKEGKIEGIKEKEESVVIKSFKNGASLDFISSITDLSNDEITSILKKHELI
jgi:predicted transposase/invertase (TIGR01784 family)